MPLSLRSVPKLSKLVKIGASEHSLALPPLEGSLPAFDSVEDIRT
jgi:hypothetical protein